MKKNRTTLKDYFKKGAIPTEANFADLIDSMLNQDEDNISKEPNVPLKILATGTEEALITFYRTENNEQKPSWQVKQKPADKPGLNISDTGAASRFFIENGSGNIGINTTTPKAKLQVVGAQDLVALRVGTGDGGADFTLDVTGGQGLVSLVAGAKIKPDGGGYTFLGTRGASRINLHDGAINFHTSDATSGTANADAVGLALGSAKMVLTNTGSLGIGVTPNANAKLAVNGNIQLSGNNDFITQLGMLRMGTPAGLNASTGKVLGAIGFWGFGVQHGQLSFRGGKGFELVDRSRDEPTLNYDYDSYPYADLKIKNLLTTGSVGIGITPSANAKLEVIGAVTFNDGGGFAVKNGYMASGSLTIGSINQDYGGGSGWNANTAGLFLEAKNNTEIAVHDSGSRLTSLMYYEGDTNNRITIGRDMGWGVVANVILNGNVGIGTATPKAKLDIQSEARTDTHPTAVRGLYVTGNFQPDSDGVEFRHFNGSQGIGFGYNTIYATGAIANQDLGLKARGTGKVIVTGSLQVNNGGQIQLDGSQKIVFSDTDTSNNLKVQLWGGYGLGINGSTLFYAANGNHSWRDNGGANERMLLTTPANGGLTVKGTGASSFAGSLGIGTTNPTRGKLEVIGTGSVQNNVDYQFLNVNSTGHWNGSGVYYSIWADSRMAAAEFNSMSDIRIKQVIGKSDAGNDLAVLKQIEITDYMYKDKISHDSGMHKKLIGQQLMKVFPQAVNQHVTDVVPDIMQKAHIENGIVHLANHTLTPKERVKLIFEDKAEIFDVETAEQDFFTISAQKSGDVFVYGREVQDFHVVDYDAIAMLNVSATQEISHQVEVLQTENATLQARVSAVEKENNLLRDEFKSLAGQIATLPTAS